MYPRVRPLLDDMNTTFTALAAQLAQIGAAVPPSAELDDISGAARMLALRAEFVLLLYAACAPHATAAARKSNLAAARALLTGRAAPLVSRQRYAVDVRRVGAWRENPTSYSYGYLWTVSSLYYWWRELGRAERGSAEATISPCYLNTQARPPRHS